MYCRHFNVEILAIAGSGGWSDIGDFGEVESEKTQQSQQSAMGPRRSISPSEAVEAARLRVQIKKLESDLAQSRCVLFLTCYSISETRN